MNATRAPLTERHADLTVLRADRAPQVRRLSQILPPPGRAAAGFPDAAALHRSAATDDPVLYEAWRDILPPRPKAASDPADTDPARYWYADLVRYRALTLPDGQPTRSTGHWNTPAQLEVFQTLTGTTVMLTATRTGGDIQTAYQICRPGDVAIIPFGAWHTTYALSGPAEVFNIYTDDQPDLGTGSRAHALDPAGKYHQGPGPDLCLLREGSGLVFTGAAPTVRHPRLLLDRPAWAEPYLPCDVDLPALYRASPEDVLAGLLRHARLAEHEETAPVPATR